MQVDNSTPQVHKLLDAQPVSPAAVSTEAPVAGPIDAMAEPTTAAQRVGKSIAASEHDALINDVRTTLRGCGESFPALVDGTSYGLLQDGFSVPFEAAVKRAKDYGLTNARDYVIGEVAVELGQKRFGYNRTNRALETPGAAMLANMLEVMAATRTMIARYPQLEPQINVYVTAKWAAIANGKLERSKALSTFALSCFNGALGKGDVPTQGMSDKIVEAIDAGKQVFVLLTAPADAQTLQTLEADSRAADQFAAERMTKTMETFFPAFKNVVDLELAALAPKAEANKAADRKLVSAEEAAKQHAARIARRESTGENKDDKLESQAAQCANDFVNALNRFGGHERFAALFARPTPSAVRSAIATLVDRGYSEPPAAVFDRTVAIILQTLAKRGVTRLGGADRIIDAPAWSAAYLRNLSGPDIASVISAPIERAGIESLSGGPSDSRSKLYEAKSVPPEARDFVSRYSQFVRELDSSAQLGEELATFDGVTGEIGRLLQQLRADGTAAWDRCNNLFDAMNKGNWRTHKSAFEEARAELRGIVARNNDVQALINTLDDESGLKKAFRMGKGDRNKVLVGGAQRLAERQKEARDYLAGVFRNYGTAMNKLRDVLEPRLAWFATAVSNSAQSRQSDPFLPLVDSGWLGVVTAELRRAEITAAHIDGFIRSLGPSESELIAPEYVGGRDALTRELIEDVANQLAEELAGKSLDDAHKGTAAAFQSRTLPALAARPRLAYLLQNNPVLDLDMKEVQDVMRYADVALQTASADVAPYSVKAALDNQAKRSDAGRQDYRDWSRMFDLSASSTVFLDELLGWRMYWAPMLARVVDAATTRDAGTSKVEDIVDAALAKGEPTTVTRATEAIGKALAAKDENAVVSYLGTQDGSVRDTARRALARLRNTTPELVLEDLVTNGVNGTPRLLAVCDLASSRQATRAATVITGILGDTDATTRAVATYALAAIAGTDQTASLAIADALVRLISDANPNVVQLASDALIQIVAKGGQQVAANVLLKVAEDAVTEPAIVPLLNAIANSKVASESVKVDAAREAERIRAYARQAGISTPRRIEQRRTVTKRKEIDMPALTLSAARGEHDVDAVSDRLKLAMRLAVKFDDWARTAPATVRAALDKLDFSEALIDDAVAELTHKAPRGYLAKTPEIVSELLGHRSFSASEVSVLATGRISERLTALANHPLATSGQWRTVKLETLTNSPEDLQAAVTLKLELTNDLPSMIGEVVSALLSETKSGIADGAYKALAETLGHDIPVLNPSLDDAERTEAVAKAKPLPPSIEALVERAVVERLALVDAKSPQAAAFITYLASGKRELGDKRLTGALERATSLPQAELIIATMRDRVKGRVTAPDASDSWLVALLKVAPNASLAQLVTVRDSIIEARRASESTSAANARDRVTTMANAIFTAHEQIDPQVLSELLGIVADGENDRDRLAAIDGLKELVSAKQVTWSLERASALRRGLLMVAQNQHTGRGQAVEQALGVVTRTVAAVPSLEEKDLGTVLEMVARCPDSVTRTRFGEGFNRMVVTQPRGTMLSSQFLVELDRWLASTEASGSEASRHRETIMGGLVKLMPIADATMSKVVECCMGMTERRVNDVLRAFADHRRTDLLTAEDVERIAQQSEGDAPIAQTESAFAKLIGTALKATGLMGMQQRWKDPFEVDVRDSDEVAKLRRELARGADFVTSTLAPSHRPQTAKADMSFFTSSTSGTTGALGAFTSRAREARDKQGAGTIQGLTQFDYRAVMDGSRQVADAARARVLEGKTPTEIDLALNQDKSRAIAAAFESSLSRGTKSRWRPAFEGPRINISRYVQTQIQASANQKRLRDAEAQGVSLDLPPLSRTPIFLKPVRRVEDKKGTRVLVNLIIDFSDSTKDEDRLAYFKKLAAVTLNSFGMVNGLDISSSLIAFSNNAHLLCAPSRRHEHAQIVQALDPLKPRGGTATDEGMDLAMATSKRGEYDMVINLVLTDGRPNNVSSARARVELARSLGQVVIGIGVGPDLSFMSETFGTRDEDKICESDVSRIPGKLFSTLERVVDDVVKS